MNWEFKTYNDFKKIHLEVKEKYKTLNREERIKLRSYIYSLKMADCKQNRIWEYLNDDKTEELLMILK